MRFTTSRHCESLRTHVSYYWPRNFYNHTLRPSLNIACLINLLKEARNGNSSDSALPAQHGKKRAFSRSSSPSQREAKRLKTSFLSANESASAEASLSRIDFVPVYHHLAEIQYTLACLTLNQNDYTHEDDPAYLQWFEEEKRLLELLDGMFNGAPEPETVELGTVTFREYHGRLVALSFPESLTDDFDFYTHPRWLLLVPPFSQEIDLEAYDYVSPNMEDILIACHRLKLFGRAKIDAHVKLTYLPFGTYDKNKNELPFCLHTDITVSLIPSALSTPIPNHVKPRTIRLEDAQRRFLDFLFPINSSMSYDGETNIPFFYSILRPAPQLQSNFVEDVMQPDSLRPTLLPFQRRGVGWMLEREGKLVTPQGKINPVATNSQLPLFWDRVQEGTNTWYINRLSGAFSQSPPYGSLPFGGILAEEQGLGKTLECIALILLNPDPSRNPTLKRWDPEARLTIKQIKTTLIVTPSSLLSQWVDELKAHAPTVKFLVYKGWSKHLSQRKGTSTVISKTSADSRRRTTNGKGRKAKRKAQSDDEMDPDEQRPPNDIEYGDEALVWEEYVNTFDVCLTTYNILRQDLTVARAVPVRPRREDVVYSSVMQPRSPLVVCEWYRVIMDEVQMVGGGKVEDMVSLIPRLSSFAVSGTPARSQVYDLIHVLNFLRVSDIIGPSRLWKRLLKPGFGDSFASFFRQYAIRTKKSDVKAELTIPQQTRFLVSVELGRVERHVYDQNLEAALLELGLDARGVAASDGWQVDMSLLRNLIRKLRGICTHPQVGQLQRKDKLYKPGALKSMTDVLEAMRDQNWRNFMDDRKLKTQALIRCAQLQQRDDENPDHYHHALETLSLAQKESNQMIDSVRAAIADHEATGEVLKKEATTLKEARRQSPSPGPEDHPMDNGKGKARERIASTPLADMDDLDDSDLLNTPAGEEHTNKGRSLQQRLRECYVCLHRVKFLQGDAYHSLGASHSPSEDAAYFAAEEMRRNLLKTTEENARRAMDQIGRQAAAKGISKDFLLIPAPYCGQGGIRSSDLMDEADEIIENIINEQSTLLWEWRSRIEALLTERLASGDEADGQEYARSLNTQGEAETYLQAYAALLADRREVLVAERTLLAAHDAKEKKFRHTKAASKAAAAAVDAELEIPGDVELQPEHEVLHKDLSIERKELLQRSRGRALRSVMVDLNAIATRIHNDKDPEKIIAKNGAQELRQLITAQGMLMDKLDADLARLRKAFNERILYFRQLQEISDSVAEVTWESGLSEAIQAAKAEQYELEAKINTSRARQRYLDHLSKNKEEGTIDEDDETCILCQCEFNRGFMTQCAHIFCEGCLKAWLLRKEGKACPVCRVIINVDQMQRFTVEEKPGTDPRLPAKPINDEPAPCSRRIIHYNMIDPTLLKEIQTMESLGSYGRKIQGLVQHLLYLQITDPGAKSIVFSAWEDSLHITEHALRTNNIPCLRIDQKKGGGAAKTFRTDPDILVLLLHGERENAGLNVTCASRVFLVESVVHHGFEVQAIARIDRMGQTRPTEVYCYYAEDTVERNILDLAVKQGLSLYTKENSVGLLNVSSLAIDTEKKGGGSTKKKVQKGDYIFETDDMLAILFPHMFEDIEYLLPAQEGTIADESPSLDAARPTPPARQVYKPTRNAIAGPSRLF